VRGELKERKREGLFRRRTRRVGDFEYRVILAEELREPDTQASLAYGVLRIEVPKAQNTGRSNRIAISESGRIGRQQNRILSHKGSTLTSA
jgi:HSP20 family protein